MARKNNRNGRRKGNQRSYTGYSYSNLYGFQYNGFRSKIIRRPESQKLLEHNLDDFKDTVYVNTHPDWKTKCEFDMCFSEEALNEILKSVGQKTPETGAKGFSPILSEDPEAPYKIGFDITEFDEIGSQEASTSIYRPNEEWGTERVNFHLDADDMRLWAGDIHSHPGSSGYPSGEVGDGLGDLGYVRKVFINFPYLRFFLLPIITLEAGRIVIHPWVIDRTQPTVPLIANVRVCPPSEFPEIKPDYSALENLEEVYDDLGEDYITPKTVVFEGPLSYCEFGGNCLLPREENTKYCPEHNEEFESYKSRLNGVLSPSFSKKRILVVGTGAGSIMCMNLARQMPAKLTLVDFDEVELHNLCRTSFGYSDIGRKKVEALKDRISDANPFVTVECIEDDITTLEKEKMDKLFDVDMIIAGTDSVEAQRFINEKAIQYQVPAIFIGIHARGRGGRIIFVETGQACYRCIAPERYEENSEEFNLNGETGGLASCQLIDNLALDIIISYLEKDESSEYGNKWDSMYNNSNEILIQLSHEHELREMWGVIHDSENHSQPTHRTDLESLFSAPRFYTDQHPRDENCQCCSTKEIKNLEVTA